MLNHVDFYQKKTKKNPPNLLCYRNEQVASFSFIIKKNLQNSYFIDTPPPPHTHTGFLIRQYKRAEFLVYLQINVYTSPLFTNFFSMILLMMLGSYK